MVLRSLENDMHHTPLTAGQTRLAKELREALDKDAPPSPEDALQKRFHELCIALFCRMNYDEGRSETRMEECPVYRFLVFACLRSSERGGSGVGGFMPANEVTPICARLEFSIRLVVFHEIFQRKQMDDQERVHQWRDNPATTDAETKRYREHWKARIEDSERLLTFVRANDLTPFAAVHATFQLATTVAGSCGISGLPLILWTPYTDHTSLSIGRALVTLEGMRELVQTLHHKAECFLDTEVMWGQQVPKVDRLMQHQQPLIDNHQESALGYSFLNDPSNGLHERYGSCLLQALFASPSMVKRFVAGRSSSGAIEYDKDACHAWLVKTGEFLNMLIALIHVSSGQPARAAELATLLIRNTQCAHRNVYWMHDTIMLCTAYHKGRNISGSDRIIPRFLPKDVAGLLLRYLVIVRPLEM
jgi:hypothetical protein